MAQLEVLIMDSLSLLMLLLLRWIYECDIYHLRRHTVYFGAKQV